MHVNRKLLIEKNSYKRAFTLNCANDEKGDLNYDHVRARVLISARMHMHHCNYY